MRAETHIGHDGIVTPPTSQEEMVRSMEEMLETSDATETDTQYLYPEKFNAAIPQEQLDVTEEQFKSMERSLHKYVKGGGEPDTEDIAADIAERYVKTSQKKPDNSYAPVEDGEYQFAKLMVSSAKPEGQPDEDGFYEYYKNDQGLRIHGGDMEIFRNMIVRNNAKETVKPVQEAAEPASDAEVKPATAAEFGEVDRRKPKRKANGGNGPKTASNRRPEAVTGANRDSSKPDEQDTDTANADSQVADKDSASSPAQTEQSKPADNSSQGRHSKRRAAREVRKTRSNEQRGAVSSSDSELEPATRTGDTAEKGDEADDAPTSVAGYLHLKQGGDMNNVDDWVYGGPTEAPRAMKVPKLIDGEPLEATVETASVTENKPTDEPDAPLVVEGEVAGVEDRPLSRKERMRSAAKKIATILAESGVFKPYENDKPKEKDPDSLGRRVKERALDLANRARYGALPTALALRDAAANAYGSPDGSGRADRITDLFRKRNEDGELGKISTGKVVAAAAGVLATAGVAYMAYRGISAGGVGNAAYNSADKGGYNPYTGGSVGHGGIAESAVPQGSGRLVNHPNIGDIVPEAASGAPKFNDEQLSNYATLHAGQRVDTAGEALQDLFRKNGVAANREQFNTLLQDALKYDADVHQFTEGKTYDPTSMPDGYRFYLMDVDDIMRRLDELK